MQALEIRPEKITKPIQIIVVWFVGLILLEGIFLTSAKSLNEPPWLSVALTFTAIIIIPVFIALIFILQTRFRTQFMEDQYYAEWLRRQEEQFKDFTPDKLQARPEPAGMAGEASETWKERELLRIRRYQENRGLFLVHTWRPSRIPGQAADISIHLQQHGEGPLTQNKIKRVEYHLGPKFYRHEITKTNTKEKFALNVSVYGSVLCLAKVIFKDGSAPLVLERYINF